MRRGGSRLGRRSVARVTASSTIPAVANIVGLAGFNTTNRYGTTALAGPLSSRTILLAHRMTAQVSGAYMLDYLDGSPGKGWRVWNDTSTTVKCSFAPAAAGTWIESKSYYPATYLNKDQVLVARNPAATNYVDLWAGNTGESAAKVGAGSACTGYAQASTGTIRFALGCRQNGSAAHTGMTVYAIAAFSADLTAAEIYAELDYFYANGRFRRTGDAGLHASATNTYNLSEDISAAGGSVPTTIQDRIGSAHMSAYAGSMAGGGGHTVVTNASDFVYTNVVPPQSDVIITMGDSMTDGRGDATALAVDVPGYEPMDGRLFMMRGASGTGIGPFNRAQLDEPCGTRDPSLQTACVGPWGILGWEIEKITGRATTVINGGVGGSLSSTWIPGQTNYNNWINRVAAALSRRNATLRALCIYGGPNDAAQGSPPNLATNITSMKADLVARFGAIPVTVQSKLTVDLGTDLGLPAATFYPSWATVQAYIASLAAADHLLATPPTPGARDGLHHDNAQNYTLAVSSRVLLVAHSNWAAWLAGS